MSTHRDSSTAVHRFSGREITIIDTHTANSRYPHQTYLDDNEKKEKPNKNCFSLSHKGAVTDPYFTLVPKDEGFEFTLNFLIRILPKI